MSVRLQRVNQLIKKALGEILLQEVKDPHIGFCTVTNVDTAPDLRTAWVSISVMGEQKEREETIQHLKKAAGYINHLLRSKVELRYTPRLNFKLDTTLDHSFRIEEILHDLHQTGDSDNQDIADSEDE